MIVTEPGTAKFDLSLGMGEYEGALHSELRVQQDLFERETVRGVREKFAKLLEEIVSDPEPGDLQAAASHGRAGERRGRARRRGPEVAIPDSSLDVLVSERARSTPDRVAVADGPRELSYAELESGSRRLAEALRDRGAGPGKVVALCAERSAAMVVSLLAILKTGATCLPLDPDYPPERLQFMLSDAGVELALAGESAASAIEGVGVELAIVDASGELVPPDAERGGEPAALEPVDPEAVAVTLYTSGTTGTPKGVLLTHRGLANHALAASRLFAIGEGDRVLQFASIGFDLSLEEIFCTLISGATLVIRTKEMPLGGVELHEWLERAAITVMDLPTAFWHEWVRDLEERSLRPPKALRLVIVGGEKASPARPRDLAGPGAAAGALDQHLRADGGERDRERLRAPVGLGAPAGSRAADRLAAGERQPARAGPARPPGPRGSAWRAAHRWPGRRPGLPGAGRGDLEALPESGLGSRGAGLPHRGPGAPPARRGAGVPRPGRRGDQAAWVPGRPRRDRGGPRGA